MKIKTVLIIIPLAILALAIPLGVFYMAQGGTMDFRSKAAPATHISLSTLMTTVSLGQEFAVNVVVDTSDNKIAQIRPVITYEPTKLDVISVIPGPFLPNPAEDKTIDRVGGKITSYMYTTQAQEGVGTVLVIQFKAKQSGSTTISFHSDTAASAIGETISGTTNLANVIIPPMNPLTVTITGGTVLPTQSLTPSISPTLSISPTPTGLAVTPTSTGIPLTSPTPTVSITPTPTLESSRSATILTPSEGESVSTALPAIEGTAPAGSTITVVINSDEPITGVVTANANGGWTFTPSTALAPGTHTVTITVTTPEGQTETKTTTFVVAENSQLPETGYKDPFVLLILLGVFLMGFGVRTLKI